MMSTTRSLNSMDVILLGATRSGKSALCGKLTGEPFNEKQYKETLGVGFHYYARSTDEETFHFKIVDTSAAKRFTEVVHSYFKGIPIVVFTLDLSQDFHAQKAWLLEENRLFNSYGQTDLANPTLTIRILLATKSDNDAGDRRVSDEQIKALRQEMNIEEEHCVTSSVKTGEIVQFEQTLLRAAGKILQERRQPQSLAKIFNDAIVLINEHSEVIKCDLTRKYGQAFQAHLEKLRDKTLIEVRSGTRKVEEAQDLAKFARNFAQKVANCSVDPEDIENFDNFTTPFISNKKTSVLSIIVGALIGAAIGVCIGAMVGLGLGPGAAMTALYAGAKGATIGAALAATLFGVAGGAATHWGSLCLFKRRDPLVQVKESAKAVVKRNRC